MEYLQDNLPLIGYVLEEGDKHLQVQNINKRQIKLQKSRTLPWSGPRLDPHQPRQELLEQLEQKNRLRNEIQDRLDPVELWELTEGETQEETAEWFSGLIWEDPGPDRIAAMGRLLMQCKTYFKFTPPVFQILSQEKVQQKLKQQEKERWRNQLISQGQALFQALWKEGSGSGAKRPEPDPEIAAELQNILLERVASGQTEHNQELFRSLTHGLPEHEHLALRLAQLWGLLPAHYNYLLDQAGYIWGDDWSQKHSQEITSQKERFAGLKQEPERLPLISIDSSTTRDIDDAFAVEPGSEGGFRLRLALAHPVLAWDFSSPLDQEVAHRASSLYLPEGTSHMLPEDLGLELYSLQAGSSRPALMLEILTNAQAEPVDTSVRFTWTEVQRNTTYDQVERELDEPDQAGQLNTALQLAEKLHHNRIRAGAVIFDQQEPEISLTQENGDIRVDLEPARQHPRAQLIVSEFMILANSAISNWAAERGLPLFHRSQDIPLPREWAGYWSDPVAMHQLIQEMVSAKLETRPQPHTSLGVRGYAPISSPLRRYLDFLNLAQLESYLRTQAPLWSEKEMEAMLPHLTARSQAATRIQKFRTRYWKLLYFQRWCNICHWTGIVVEDGDLVTVSLPREQMLLRAPRRLFGEKIRLGQSYSLTLGKVDPLNNQIKILDAQEE